MGWYEASARVRGVSGRRRVRSKGLLLNNGRSDQVRVRCWGILESHLSCWSHSCFDLGNEAVRLTEIYVDTYVYIDFVALPLATHSSKLEMFCACNSHQNLIRNPIHPFFIHFLNQRFKTGMFLCLYPYHSGFVLPYPLLLPFPFGCSNRSSIALAHFTSEASDHAVPMSARPNGIPVVELTLAGRVIIG